jgi:DNA-binding CsgD family transcriptional regulator
MSALIGDLKTGRGGAIWLEGDPGVGKTALVDAALDTIMDSPIQVFRAAGDELLQVFALYLIVEAMRVRDGDPDDLRTEIADLLAGRRHGGSDATLSALEKLLDLVDLECGRRPSVLVLDDVQWADEASLAACSRLVSVVDQIPLMLVLVARRVPRRPAVGGLRQAVTARPAPSVLEITGLTSDEVASAAAKLLSAQVGPRLRAALARAAGNPLYVREMVNVLRNEGALRVEGGTADLAEPFDGGVSSLGEVIGRRLAFLSGRTRTTLQAAAMLRVQFGHHDLALVSGRSHAELIDVVDEAVACGVLVGSGRWLGFRHPVIRQALHDEVPSAMRSALHAHMAKSLAAAGAPWDDVAQHVLAAGPDIDASMVGWLAQVPRSALVSRPAVAADLLDRGWRATPAGDPRRARFTALSTTVLRLLHRQDDLVTVGERALKTISDKQLLSEAAWNLAVGLGLAGRYAELGAVIARILDGPGAVPPWSARLRALGVSAPAFGGQRAEAEQQAQLAIAEGEQIGDPVAIAWALHFLALTAPNYEQAAALVDRAVAVLVDDDPDSIDLRLLLQTNQILILSTLNRVAEVEAALPAMHALAETAGSARLSLLKWGIAEYYMFHGRWDEALVYLDQITDVTDATYTLIVRGAVAEIAVHRGDRAAAERNLNAVRDLSYLDGPLRIYAYRTMNAESVLAEWDGRPDRALTILRRWLDPEFAGGRLFRPEVMRHIVRLALAVGDLATAELAATAAQADADASGGIQAVEDTICRAMLDDSPQSLLAVVGDLEKAARPVACAFVLQEAAVRLAQRNDLTAARSAFARAVAIYEDLGAVWDLRQIESRLRPLGIRRGPRSPHHRAESGWEALTLAERNVARLVVSGESNSAIASRLLISRRTVATHVGHILSKLNVRSRVDIARELAQHGETW